MTNLPNASEGHPLPSDADRPLLPDYQGPCISNIVPALLGGLPASATPWMPEAGAADQVVLFVIDGLGWELLRDREHLAPNLAAMAGQPITSVVPTTTSAALTSISTGCPPGEHGMVGYRIRIGGETLNLLTWMTAAGPAQKRLRPSDIQRLPAFLDKAPPVVNKAEFARTAFTEAHHAGVDFVGYRTTSAMVSEVERLVRCGERFVYTYYDGLDKIGHEFGFGDHFDRELVACDRLVGDLLDALPPTASLLVTADHGQVHSGDDVVEMPVEVARHVQAYSGEDRFRWLHAAPGHEHKLHDAALEHFGELAWVRTRQEAIDEGWFGARVSSEVASRYGDVVLAAKATTAFISPDDPGSARLVGRHGSLTPAEMLVPLLGAFGRGTATIAGNTGAHV